MSERRLTGTVVVVTGASSGIGRAAALRFAREGAVPVLAARSAEALEELAAECRDAGGRALAVPTDVTDEDAVARLARRAVDEFGRIDVWVNNAGIIVYGHFEQTPAEDFRRVIETNLFGQVHGSRAAIAQFRRQGRGVLVNLSSVWGRIPSPYVSAYVTSKFAVRAFSECLRYELDDCPEIHVSTILPEAVDTPIFDHAGNRSGREVRPIPPLVDADAVAREIVACALSPRREVTFGRAGRMLEHLFVNTPRLYGRLAPTMFVDGSFGDPTDHRRGNLYDPTPGPASGDWKAHRRRALAAAFAASLRGLVRGALGRPPG